MPPVNVAIKGKPNAAKKLQVMLTIPTIKAYGSCVRTWSIWLQPDASELNMVVSDMGEQWSPRTEALSTTAITLYKMGRACSGFMPAFRQKVQVMGMAMGYKIAIVLQLDPVEKEIRAAKIKMTTGMAMGLMVLPSEAVKNSAVANFSVTAANDHANSKMSRAGSMVLKPVIMVFIAGSMRIIFCDTVMSRAHNRAANDAQSRAR